MTLSEKIAVLRKKNGWSQEDFADKCSVSRQAVSKWENGESVPELEKIVRMSDLFGVCTDFLLKDTGGANPSIENTDSDGKTNTQPKGRFVSLEQAIEYMEVTKVNAKNIALSVVVCILSPVCLILLEALQNADKLPFSEQISFAIGLAVLIVLVAFAVASLILNGFKLAKYEFLDHEAIELPEEAKRMVIEKRDAFAPTYRACIVAGVMLCILSSVPVILYSTLHSGTENPGFSVVILLAMVACGVFLFVNSGSVQSSYKKLLQEEDFSVNEKALNKKISPIFGCYWSLVVATYLFISIKNNAWGRTWIIWPLAGVLSVAISRIMKIFAEKTSAAE